MNELPENWACVPLPVICTKITDGTHHSPPNTQTGDFKYVTAKNIRRHGLDLEDITYVPRDVHETIHARCPVEKDDVLYIKDGATTGLAINNPLDEPFSLLSSVALLKPDRDVIDPHFLKYWLNSPDTLQSMVGQMSGSAIRRLTLTTIAAQELPLAPLPEQRRIVAKLDSLRGRSARAQKELDLIPKLIERYKQAILAKAFSGELTADWRRHHSHLVPIKARELTGKRARVGKESVFEPPYDIPKAWRWLQLVELGDLDRGRSRHRPRNDARLFGGEYPFIQTGDVRAANRYLNDFGQTYSEFGLAQSRLWPKGTVCITIAANIGETAILNLDACFPDSVVGFTADSDRTTAEYIEYFVRTVRGDLERFAPATAQKNINLEILDTVGVPTAPLEEQKEIVRRLDIAFAWLDKIATERARAEHLLPKLDQAILSKAFRGELVPQDPNDEPVSVLMDRICSEREGSEQPTRHRGR